MRTNVKEYIGKGVAPRQFIEGMTRNQEAFQGWYDKFAWADERDRDFFQTLSGQTDLRCLIIAAAWCGDVVRNVPAVLRVVETVGIPIEIFVMEEHLDFIDDFLTMGGRSIPVVLFVHPNGDIQAKWGPRPRHVQEVMVAFKQNHADRQAADYEDNLKAARTEMMSRYGEGTDYQVAIVKELREVLSGR
jgi:hypothetical protein